MMRMEFSAQRVSPSPQELDAWLRSTELDNDGSRVIGGLFGGIGHVSPEIGDNNTLELDGTKTRMDGDFASRYLNEFRLPFMQGRDHRGESPDHNGSNHLGSPRVVSSHYFVRALERSEQSQAEIDRFDSDDSGGNNFNAALLTARTRRMLLDSALCNSSFTSDLVHNHIDPHGRRANNATVGEEDTTHALSPLTQVDPDGIYDGDHLDQQHQHQNSSMNENIRRNREDSRTHLDMLNMLRSMVDDDTATMTTSDTNTRGWMRGLSAYSTRDLYPEDAVRVDLLRIEREQLEYEEARLGL